MKWAIYLKPEQGRQHSLGKGSRRPLLKDPTRGSSLRAGTQLSSDSRFLTRLQWFPEKAFAQGEPNHSCPQTTIFQSKTARAGAQLFTYHLAKHRRNIPRKHSRLLKHPARESEQLHSTEHSVYPCPARLSIHNNMNNREARLSWI